MPTQAMIRQSTADVHVVRDVHLVVDLGAAPDPRVVERPAIHAAVGSDLDIVRDDAAADVRNTRVPRSPETKPNPVPPMTAAALHQTRAPSTAPS